MITINTELLELIENEILHNNQPTYQRIIPISDYTFETKKTLDILVEKYGGFVNRYDDKIIIFINYSIKKQENTFINTDSFENINSILSRLTVIEEKIDKIIEDHKDIIKNSTKSVYSYLNYFQPKENKKEIGNLVNEIINHH